jgi:hypothetical protein
MSEAGDHAIVEVVSADEREVLARLAALEAEVKADADARRARREEALAKVRAERARREAQKQELAARQAALAPRPPAGAAAAARPRAPARSRDDDDDASGFELVARGAKLATTAKKELARPREKGDKSWLASGALSFFFGPLGWLYAGSLREAIPASFLYLLVLGLLSKLPIFLVWPVMMVVMPISAIAGVVYAIQHNRHGERTRLFDKEEDAQKRLGSGD